MDPYLTPYLPAIEARRQYAERQEQRLTGGGRLADFATGYLYFGLQPAADGWTLREWAPNATGIHLIGDMNGWQRDERYAFSRVNDAGVWELRLPASAVQHGQHYKLLVSWPGGEGERIPAWAQRVVQDEQTKVFSAQVWAPEEPYLWQVDNFKPRRDPLLIYEAHIGMSGEEERVATYDEFRRLVLPRIKADGYNCVQLMAIQEHPYYGSFGYHVSSFFAPSSRFGTPDELRRLIDEAHGMGLAVIMDLVHSHAVKNETEGLGRFDGTDYQYFHAGARHQHPAWDSLCFDYGKPEVLHFLLSNCKYWLDSFRFDGFRFDGVTSMIYLNHGLGQDFTSYADYYDGNQDGDAICYLTLANRLIHEVRPEAITVAEEMSGMPLLAAPIGEGGMGFDYRLAMGIPDFWIKTIKEVRDEDWHPGHILWELTNRRADEQTISYVESHDQALVGDKTVIFRLVDADMYWHMRHGDATYTVSRGIALHKMIRLITLTTINGGYLNFMGNEFGHPEWIDFPREGNGWSHKYARRQWSLVDNENFYYHDLGEFDRAMIGLVGSVEGFNLQPVINCWDKQGDQVLAYMRGDLLFVYNFSGTRSYDGYGMLVPEGSYRVVLNTDDPRFGGFGLTDDSLERFTTPDPNHTVPGRAWLRLYLPARSAVVLKRVAS